MAQFWRSLLSRVIRVENWRLWLTMAALLLAWRLSLSEASHHVIYAQPLNMPEVVYVDDNWVGLANGTTVDADPGPGLINAIIGTDAFATIQAGVNAVDPAGTVNVLAGTYTELVTVNKTATLRGAQQGVDARTRPFVAANESLVNNPGGSFSLQANSIVLDGFTVQGANSNAGIYLSGAFSGYIIRNNIIRNNVFGLYPHSSGVIPTTIQYNLFQANNVAGPANGNGLYSDQGLINALIDSNLFVNHFNSAMLITHVSETNANITISNNQIPSGSLGITLGGVTHSLITRNTITNSTTVGIYFIGDNNNITVLHNRVTGAALDGMRASTFAPLGPNQNLHLDANTLTGNPVGIRIEANSLSSAIDANCNFIQGNTVGLRNDETDGVDATLNWWGNATGPTHASNPGGTGQVVQGSAVNVLPFGSSTVACVGLTKTAAAPTVVAGTRLTYTLVVSNAGASPAAGVVLTDTLPADVSYAAANPTPSGTNPLNWTVGTVTPGQSLTYTVVVTVNANATGNLTNTATLLRAAPANTVTATATTHVISAADLSLTKSDNPDPVIADTALIYTLSIVNSGPGTATGVIVTDALPDGLTFGGVSGPGWNCTHRSRLITCTVVGLPVGSAPNIVITGTAPITPGIITNSAVITSTTPDSNTANSTATITTTVSLSGQVPGQNIYLPLIMKHASSS